MTGTKKYGIVTPASMAEIGKIWNCYCDLNSSKQGIHIIEHKLVNFC